MTLTTPIHAQAWFMSIDITILQLIAVLAATTSVLAIFHGHTEYVSKPIEGWPPDVSWWPRLARIATVLDRIVTLALIVITFGALSILLNVAWTMR